MSQRYFQKFSDVESVRSEFKIGEDALKDEEVLIAWYGYGSYSGGALVLFQRDGVLYEVSGSHCSCDGLEGQWEPSEVTWDQLAMRPLNDGNYYDDDNGAARAAFAELVYRHVPRA